MPRTEAHAPLWYLSELSGRGLDVNSWQTTYFHAFDGVDAVLEWVRSTTLRTILERTSKEKQGGFIEEHAELLRRAYPSRDGNTVFPFKRTFVVAEKRKSPGKTVEVDVSA